MELERADHRGMDTHCVLSGHCTNSEQQGLALYRGGWGLKARPTERSCVCSCKEAGEAVTMVQERPLDIWQKNKIQDTDSGWEHQLSCFLSLLFSLFLKKSVI